MRIVHRLACLYVLLLGSAIASAQDAPGSTLIFSTDGDHARRSAGDTLNQMYTIRNIIIEGNKKTNSNIILRELGFQIDEGYSLEELSKRFHKAQKQLMNTGLFRDVTVSLKTLSGNDAYVNISVNEKWYIWPQPFVHPVDKSFHQWWAEKNRSMDRINYGINFAHENFTGRNDKLTVNLMNGYTKQLSIQYYGLFLDEKLKWSLSGGISMGRNREVNYMTRDDKPVTLKNSNEYLRSYTSWFGRISYRPAIKTRHSFSIGYSAESFADTIYKLNPYFSRSQGVIRYPEISYRLNYYDVDFIPYPTKGYMAEVSLKKKGFNDPVNLWQLNLKGLGSWHMKNNYFFTLNTSGMIKLPFNQPYFTRQFLGYDNQFLQGYEYYVVDGVAGGYAKAAISRQVFSTNFSFFPKKIRGMDHVPLKIYAKTFVNGGYVYNPHPGQNDLANKLLYSAGVGLDLVTFTDFVIKIEWSFNRLGENGLYLHQHNNF
jgi:outer membrane protein assembly factor BamA